MNKYNTIDDKKPEIDLHSDYIQWFKDNQIDIKAWGSRGPDILLPTLGFIGEVKKEFSVSLLKAAVNELFNRKEPEFMISNYQYFFVILGNEIRVYDQTDKSSWDKVDLDKYIYFEKKDRKIFLDFLKNHASKIPVESCLDYVLDFILNEKLGISVSDGLKILFNINNSYAITNKSIFFNPDTDNEIEICFNANKENKKELINFIKIFKINSIQTVKDYIKHNYSSHLPDSKKANLGKYYTPKEIVELVKNEIRPKINEKTVVMDLACGCGAFLELFDDCHIIGRDIDEQALEILDLFNFSNIEQDNSLLNVQRAKYNLSDSDDLIIIGNPPYNDSTSINKRYSTKAKNSRPNEDKDIHRRDIGRSFLEAYAKLKPRYICVLHPLAYLIKKANFNNLKLLSKDYKLVDATIFSSKIFKDLDKGSQFPIIVATYALDNTGMDYEYIKNFIFKIYKSNKRFTLKNIEQAGHDYIHQTVTSSDTNGYSDIQLYHYNFRDINSLNKANFQSEEYRETRKSTMVVVNFEDLWKYCYVNCCKKFLIPLLPEDNNYILGNLNPIIDKKQIENGNYLKDLFIVGAILKNSHRIAVLNIDNRKNNILSKKFLINDFNLRAKNVPQGKINFYEIFLKYVDTKDEKLAQKIYDLITDYFRELIKKCFISDIDQ
ncbi:MAG: N-6 DNA methylase [Succinivibrio sp.]|nr:N-6 DNA methylase [Succinivibrio sp.]